MEVYSVFNDHQIYFCSQVVANSSIFSAGNSIDYAVLRASRTFHDGYANRFVQFSDVQVNEPVFSVGNPSGLPNKWAYSATVKDIVGAAPTGFYNKAYGYNTDLDLFADGQLGSPVFDQKTGKVMGLFVAGGPDFEVRSPGCVDYFQCSSVDLANDQCSGSFVQSICVFSDHNSNIQPCAGQLPNTNTYGAAASLSASIFLMGLVVIFSLF